MEDEQEKEALCSVCSQLPIKCASAYVPKGMVFGESYLMRCTIWPSAIRRRDEYRLNASSIRGRLPNVRNAYLVVQNDEIHVQV